MYENVRTSYFQLLGGLILGGLILIISLLVTASAPLVFAREIEPAASVGKEEISAESSLFLPLIMNGQSNASTTTPLPTTPLPTTPLPTTPLPAPTSTPTVSPTSTVSSTPTIPPTSTVAPTQTVSPTSTSTSTSTTTPLPTTTPTPFVGDIAQVLADTDSGLVPVKNRIFSTTTLTIQIDLLTALDDVQVQLTNSAGALTDLTSDFGNLAATESSSATLFTELGDLTLNVIGIRGNETYTQSEPFAVMDLNRTASILSNVAYESIRDDDLDISYEANTILILFDETASLEEMSAFLQTHELAPLDISMMSKLVRAEIQHSLSPIEMTALLSGTEGVTAVDPNIIVEGDSAVGETMPTRLTNSYRDQANANCSGGGDYAGCFDHSGDVTDELAIFRYHFFMDTFAGHRLVNHLVPARTVSTTIAILDSGITVTGTEPLDIPTNEFVHITNMSTVVFDLRGRPTIPISLTAIPDLADHGTSVTAAAAGRGRTSLGTGIHPLVRPVFHGNTLARVINALENLALDANVVAINHSFSVNGGLLKYQRVLRRLRNPYFDRNGNTRYDLGEPFGDTNGNGLYDGAGDGKILVQSAGNRGRPITTRLPRILAPTTTRTLTDTLLMPVSGVETHNRVHGPEQLRHASNFGPQISVAAPGGDVLLPNNQGVLTQTSGTSLAAPHVTGLIGEITYMDQHINPPANRFSPLQVIELVEATADDLGTKAVTGTVRIRPNDTPGNGVDNFFGHGRINVWKALLATVNRGVASESHPQLATNFPSLNPIDEANTKWYGFKIHAPIHGTTIWLDGLQVTDTVPISRVGNISAYAGVGVTQTILIGVDDDHDGTLDEDPTSGIVPIGSQSNFIATFSIQRANLVKDSGEKVLQLRRPGQTKDDAPFYNLALDLSKMRTGEVPGVVFDDFVFEITLPDFGDASAENTALDDDGAYHVNHLFEYFGTLENEGSPLDAASPELSEMYAHDPDGIGNHRHIFDPEGVILDTDLDRYDDGITFYPLTYLPGGQGRADFTVCVTVPGDRYDRVDRNKQLFVNAWLDWDTDAEWEEGASKEHVINGLRLAPTENADGTTNWTPLIEAGEAISATVTLLESEEHCAKYKALFTLPATIGTGRLESRWRIDYGENVGRHANTIFDHLPKLNLAAGPAHYGEVEDYVIGPDFGDAPDAPYNTKKASNGPRHLNVYREWIGLFGQGRPSASREPDACNTINSDQDGTDNLSNDCTQANLDSFDDFSVVVVGPGKIQVDFDVSSTVQGYGYTGSNAGVSTLKSDCTLQPITNTVQTPAHQQAPMRYDAGDASKRLYVSLWADWNGDGAWDAQLLTDEPVDPEDFGDDGAYTLGDAFDDDNHDGVWTVNENFTDGAGTPTRQFSCLFDAPVPLPPEVTAWFRMRLSYGETGGLRLHNPPNEEDPAYVPMGPDGGMAWGEVEDVPLSGLPEIKVSTPDIAIPGEVLHYAITVHGNPTLTEPTQGQMTDPLPDLLEFQGELTCSSGECAFDPETRTVAWQGELTSESEVTIEFDTRVPIETVPLDWPEIVNQAEIFDGVATILAEDVTPMQCVPIKRADLDTVTPGQTIRYTIAAPLHPALTEPRIVRIQDQLPDIIQQVENVVCLPEGSECGFDPETRLIFLSAEVLPEEQAILEFDAIVQDDLPPSACPPEIINDAVIFDGVGEQMVGSTVALVCEE